MSIKALIFMIFIFTICLGGFIYSLYLSSKKK
jgi:hypothetical protein